MNSTGTQESLEALLRRHSVPRQECCSDAEEPEAVRCVACAHRCLIRPGRGGICKVRFNEAGSLRVPYGYVAGGLAADPIEKKPFYHVLPGSRALSFGMLGCDMHCSYCQNWYTSQALRDSAAGARIMEIGPEEILEAALRAGCRSVVSTYNEPLITAEWAADIFDLCRPAGLRTGFVSNGNATPEVLDYLAPRLDLYKVDLKTFQDRAYRKLGAVLENILGAIDYAYSLGLWVEVVTLVVPGFNDSSEELGRIAEFIASVSPDIPWHVTAFRPDYKMTDRGPTTVAHLLRAVDAGRGAGLRYIYAGNAHGLTDAESTICPGCGQVLVERVGYGIGRIALTGGRCPRCELEIPGIWG